MKIVGQIAKCRACLIFPTCFGCTGFRWDRQWLVVNSKGRAYTQRVEPKLALVEVELPNEAFVEGWEPTKSSYLGKKNVNFLFCYKVCFRSFFYHFYTLSVAEKLYD